MLRSLRFVAIGISLSNVGPTLVKNSLKASAISLFLFKFFQL